jgi:hypothetical protein
VLVWWLEVERAWCFFCEGGFRERRVAAREHGGCGCGSWFVHETLAPLDSDSPRAIAMMSVLLLRNLFLSSNLATGATHEEKTYSTSFGAMTLQGPHHVA